MSTIYKAILDCVWCSSRDIDSAYVHSSQGDSTRSVRSRSCEQQLATDVVNALLFAEKPGKDLDERLKATVHTYGWRESLAKRVLQALQKAIETGASMSLAMQEACEKARTIAAAFVKEHPVLAGAIITLIAIGVLVLLAPYIVEALGFGELGPIEGSWAAWWQSGFGNVPKGSFFAWLQRLGMTWRAAVVAHL